MLKNVSENRSTGGDVSSHHYTHGGEHISRGSETLPLAKDLRTIKRTISVEKKEILASSKDGPKITKYCLKRNR